MFKVDRYCCPKCGVIYRGAAAHCSRDGAALEVMTNDSLVGRRLKGGRYHLRRSLGEGSAGRVYEGEDLETGEEVAIKVLFGEHVTMPDVLERFRREAVAAGRLAHPHISSVIDAGLDEPDEPLFLVMQLVKGRTLTERVEQDGPLSPEHASRVFAGLTSALAHAHERGVLHRDVKPDNVILAHGDDAPKLIDFGVSKVIFAEANRKLTSYGRVIGTPGFVAPEVLRGDEADARADLYGLGVCAYFALSGQLPFGSGEMDSVSQTLEGLKLERLDGVVPAALGAWVRSITALEPDDRPRDATVAHQRLIYSIPEASGDFVDPSRRNRRRRVAAVSLLATGAIVALVGLSAKFLSEPDRDASPTVSSPAREPPPAVRPAVKISEAPPPATVARKPARPSSRKRPSASSRRARAAKARSAEAQRNSPSAKGRPEHATTQDLISEYSELGRQLDALAVTPATEKLRKRYLDLPIADTLRRPERVDEVMARLKRLAGDIRAAGRGPVKEPRP